MDPHCQNILCHQHFQYILSRLYYHYILEVLAVLDLQLIHHIPVIQDLQCHLCCPQNLAVPEHQLRLLVQYCLQIQLIQCSPEGLAILVRQYYQCSPVGPVGPAALAHPTDQHYQCSLAVLAVLAVHCIQELEKILYFYLDWLQLRSQQNMLWRQLWEDLMQM